MSQSVAAPTAFPHRARLLGGLARLRGLVTHVTLIAVCVIVAAPFLWMLKVSVSPESDVFTFPPTALPRSLQLSNWPDAWTNVDFPRYFLNSAIMTVTVTLGNLLVCAMAAYSFARMKVPGRNALFLAVLASIMIPGQVLIIPQFLIMAWLGWVNTYWALIVPPIGSAFGVFLLRQFFLQIPADLEDAARIDGCGWFGVFFRIILPLASAGLIALGLLTALGTWNAFLWPLIVTTSPDMFPVQIGLRLFYSDNFQRWGMTMAATCFVTIPVLVLFVVGQRYLVRGIVMTGFK
jgi:multiple sugar transport system permease protein